MQNLMTLKASGAPNANNTVLATTMKGHFRSHCPYLPGHNYPAGVKCCTTCTTHSRPYAGHGVQFCAHSGSAYTKQGFDAAREATLPAKGKTMETGQKVYTQLTGLKEKVYLMEKTALEKLQTLSGGTTTTDFAALATYSFPGASMLNDAKWEGWMVIAEEEYEPVASINWNVCSKENQTTIAPTSKETNTALMAVPDQPFFIDSGATVHILPYKSDFVSFQSILPKAIKGVGGSSITAHGVGNIHLHTAEGTTLTLLSALYVPNSTVHLILVSRISADSNMYSRFDKQSINIVDCATNSIIAKGPLMSNKKLYTINLSNAEHAYATNTNLVTWHRHLGHANYQAILQLAQDRCIKGVLPQPHHPLPKCDSCILGKQARTPVPKAWQEERRATRKLGIVWADLMSPMSI